MRRILFAILLLTAISCSGKKTAYTLSELDQAYLSMPQLLFEDLCLEHSDWSDNQMATYYLDNIEVLSKIYDED